MHWFVYDTLYLDVVGVCEEHSETVDAHSPACCRRQAVLESSAERLINEHGFVITLCLCLGMQSFPYIQYTDIDTKGEGTVNFYVVKQICSISQNKCVKFLSFCLLFCRISDILRSQSLVHKFLNMFHIVFTFKNDQKTALIFVTKELFNCADILI